MMDEQRQTTTEVTQETRPVATSVGQADRVVEKTNSSVVASRVVWYVVGFILVLLAIRLVLFLFGANQGSGFVGFMYAISGVFATPFSGIFPAPSYGQFFFDTASLVAMVVYMLIGWGISKLFTITHREA